MKITKIGDYALRSVLYLSTQPVIKISAVSEICKDCEIPYHITAKIMQKLIKAGIVRSFQGNKGGFKLAKPANEITIKNVIEAIEGPIVLNDCSVNGKMCSMERINCSIHPIWRDLQQNFIDSLDSYTMDVLSKKEKKIKKLIDANVS